MSIVFGAICPHPPVLLPSIGKENSDKLQNTKNALTSLEESIYIAKPDTIIVISPHGIISSDIFHLNIADKFYSNLEEFGDFTTKLEFSGDIQLASTIKQKAEVIDFPVSIISEEKLDHGVTIPLNFLASHFTGIKILPISYSMLSLDQHFEFGKFLYKELIKNDKRVAIIASGDLSHRLSEEAPAGYSPKGKEFDEIIQSLLAKKDTEGILKIDPELIKESGECGLKSIITILGIFDEINYSPEILSYENPFGIGYMVANLKIQ